MLRRLQHRAYQPRRALIFAGSRVRVRIVAPNRDTAISASYPFNW
jgi:hypothetical protein